MQKLYQLLSECDPFAEKRILTVLDEPFLGEKALYSNGKLLYTTHPHGFFSSHSFSASDMERFTGTGVYRLNSIGDGVQVFCEIPGSEKKLVICGGGHVSISIIRMALLLDFHVTVLEDRPMFADNARRAGASRVICDSFEKALDSIPGDSDTFFVIVTRGHRFDLNCLRRILKKPHGYIGMMGSRMRVHGIQERLLEEGYSHEQIQSVHAPIGISIGAETPAEIAVSILAEIIQIKNTASRSCCYPKDFIRHMLDQSSERSRKVFSVILRRRGSAPREAGTCMIIYPDGTTEGTVGGGCAEARIIQKALSMLNTHNGVSPSSAILRVDMTGQDAEEDGMVCGGVIDVLLQYVNCGPEE